METIAQLRAAFAEPETPPLFDVAALYHSIIAAAKANLPEPPEGMGYRPTQVVPTDDPYKLAVHFVLMPTGNPTGG